MKTYLYLLAFVMAASVFGQPQIPPSNIYPVPSMSLIGRYSAGSGRGQTVTLGGNLTLSSLGVLDVTGGGGGGAPTNGTYITQTPNASLSAEQALSLLSTGLMKVTTATGVISTAVSGTDYLPITGGTGITTLGTVTTGTWGATTIAVNKGGTGQTAYTNGQLLIGNTTSGGLDKASLTAGTNITITPSAGGITIAASGGGSGNVTNNATLASGNVILGGGTTVVGTSNISTTGGNNMAVPGNVTIGGDLAVTGNQTVGNFTATTMNVTTNIASSGTTNGQLWIGSTASGNFTKATLTAGDNISITNGANSITINATGGGGSGTVNAGTAGQMAYYPASAAAVSGTVLPKFEIAGTNNVSAFTLYNAMTYPFAKTDTTGRNIFWVGSNDASNPFGMSMTATGHAATPASRKLLLAVGGIGVAELGLFQILAQTTAFLTREGTGNTGLQFVTTDALTTISHEFTNGSIHIKPNGTGYFHVGVTDYAVGAYSIPNSFAYPAAKTSTSPVNAFFVGSNDASNPFGLNVNITGDGTATNRIVKLQVGAVGVDSSGDLRLDGTKVSLYGASSTLSATATSTQLIAETTTASTSTTSGALMSKGGLGVAGNGHFGGDVEIADIGEGVIIKSPDGTRYRLTVANGGTLVITGL